MSRKHTSGRKSAATKKAHKPKKELLDIDRRWRALHADATSCDKPLRTLVLPDPDPIRNHEQGQRAIANSRLYRDLSTEKSRPSGIELLEQRLERQQRSDRPNLIGAKRKIVAPSRKPDGNVSKRRTLVCNHRDASREEVCEILDREGVPVPDRWEAAGVKRWEQACKDRKYVGRIDTIFSKHRR